MKEVPFQIKLTLIDAIKCNVYIHFCLFLFFVFFLGEQARSMLIQSGLSQGILAQIW